MISSWLVGIIIGYAMRRLRRVYALTNVSKEAKRWRTSCRMMLKHKGIGAGVIFIVQRDNALCFESNDSTDPEFGKALRAACAAGVDLWVYGCRVSPDRIVIIGQIPMISNRGICFENTHHRCL